MQSLQHSIIMVLCLLFFKCTNSFLEYPILYMYLLGHASLFNFCDLVTEYYVFHHHRKSFRTSRNEYRRRRQYCICCWKNTFSGFCGNLLSSIAPLWGIQWDMLQHPSHHWPFSSDDGVWPSFHVFGTSNLESENKLSWLWL